jgi:hypothetical protein
VMEVMLEHSLCLSGIGWGAVTFKPLMLAAFVLRTGALHTITDLKNLLCTWGP